MTIMQMKNSYYAAALLFCASNSQAILSGSEAPAAVVKAIAFSEAGAPPSARGAAEADLPFPSDMECVLRPVYRHRADGQPGREVTLRRLCKIT